MQVRVKISGPEGFVRSTGEEFFQGEIKAFVQGRAPEYTRTAASELKYEEVREREREREMAQLLLTAAPP